MSKHTRNLSSIKLLKIINIIADYDNGIGITELSKKLNYNKSTVYRFVATLYEEGYLKQDIDTKKYKIGLNLFSLGLKLSSSTDSIKTINPYLVELRNQFEETVHLGIQNENKVIYIDKVESNQSIRMYSKIGKRSPMYCTGVGKAILANLPIEEKENIIENLKFKKYTENTIIDKNNLNKELNLTKKRGYSLDIEEHEKGVLCVAVPLFNIKYKLVGGLSIAGPKNRITKDDLKIMGLEMIKVADKLSKHLIEL